MLQYDYKRKIITENNELKEKLSSLFSQERHQLILWLPVFFGAGIALYFALPTEPTLHNPMAMSALFGSMLLLSRRNIWAVRVLILMIMFSGGFAVAMFRAHQVQAPVIADEWKKSYAVTATIEQMEARNRGSRIWLSDVSSKDIKQEWTPKRIRVTVNSAIDHLKTGDRVDFLAVLYPPPLPAMPGAYDFARQAYFEQIGAVGYVVSKMKLVERDEAQSFAAWLSDMRHQLAESIRREAPAKEQGAIAAALLVGERGAIPSVITDQMRDAGLAHLLAISGLHLALVATICFFTFRLLMACSSYLALRHPIKQYAAFMAIIASLLYLLITGAPISAQRAFLMTGLVLLSIMLNRSVTPLRSIGLAAFIILLLTPESILSPSFQMSFAAAGALISAFEFLRKYMASLLEDASMMRRVGVYLIGILLSSLVAGLATAPFALYHFSHMSNYSLLANLVAVPLTSLWIMPWGVATLILAPFGLEWLSLYPMGWGIDVVLNVAEYISSLPYATPAVPAMPMVSLALITVAFLWLGLWKSKIRVAGLILLLPAIYFYSIKTAPDILVNEDGRMLAFRNNAGEYEFPAKTSPNFVRESWLERLGKEETIRLKPNQSSDNLLHEGDRNYIYTHKGTKILFAHDKEYLEKRCKDADYLVDMYWYEIMQCPNAPTLFNRQDLDLRGTHVVYLQEGQAPLIDHVRGYRGERLW